MSSSIPEKAIAGGGDVSGEVEIREVWADNLEEEFAVIRSIVEDYPFVAMDTEFPGVAIRPLDVYKTMADLNYHTVRANVDLLHLIQIGFAFSTSSGELPCSPSSGRPCIWQFNFREFDPDADVSAPDSLDLLIKSGLDFAKNRERGVDALRFAELLMSSGVVLNNDVVWVTFHSAYDFGYLLKVLTCRKLPDTSDGFFELMRVFFPNVYDIKHLTKFCSDALFGGLSYIAEILGVERVGISHQAGSDSLVTLECFWKVVERYLKDSVEKYEGVLYGLGDEYSQLVQRKS
ncbi:probable CCR4-associated factor 1 homolog 7 [Typha angustifolia]|uniref:probable CCR4-associated factor 1 homolog 7 n=1 Tax=Typha angustifolia TaxID=59011 RepID=UPI003C2AD3EE